MTGDLPVFSARVTREDNLWVIVVEGVLPPGSVAATDTPRFADIATETRDLIADLADLDEDQFWIQWRYVVNGRDVTTEIRQYQDAEHDYRTSSAHLQALRDSARGQVLETLARTGLPQRAISEVVDLSQQRVNQILREDRAAGPRASAG